MDFSSFRGVYNNPPLLLGKRRLSVRLYPSSRLKHAGINAARLDGPPPMKQDYNTFHYLSIMSEQNGQEKPRHALDHIKSGTHWVYILRLKDNRHYYVGATSDLAQRIYSHIIASKGHLKSGSCATRAYGFNGNIIGLFSCETREEAFSLELKVATFYRELFPDIPICGDYYPFGSYIDKAEKPA